MGSSRTRWNRFAVTVLPALPRNQQQLVMNCRLIYSLQPIELHLHGTLQRKAIIRHPGFVGAARLVIRWMLETL